MSRFTQATATMHTLSLAAMEEASRFSVRDADIDHLLLALTIDADTGGQVLRGLGIGLDAARAAVAAQHAAQLESVGLTGDSHTPGRIVFHETTGYEWTDRALAVLKDASRGALRGDSAAVLRALLTEPSGLVEAVLRRLDVDSAEVVSRLDDVERLDLGLSPSPADAISGSRSIFVPASIDEVWALLSSAERIPEWDAGIAAVHVPETAPGSWEAVTRTTSPDGRTFRVKPAYMRQRVDAVDRDASTSVSWRYTHPDAARANPRLIAFALEHAAGGMQLRVKVTWETPSRRGARRVLRTLLRPVYRFVLFVQLAQIESGITRVFR